MPQMWNISSPFLLMWDFGFWKIGKVMDQIETKNVQNVVQIFDCTISSSYRFVLMSEIYLLRKYPHVKFAEFKIWKAHFHKTIRTDSISPIRK